MIQKIFSVYDNKAKAWLPPFASINAATAARSFAECVRDPGHQFARHTLDYTLFMIGTWDDITGTLVNEPQVSLGLAETFRESAREFQAPQSS